MNTSEWNRVIEELAQIAEARPPELIAASANRCKRIAAWLRAQKR